MLPRVNYFEGDTPQGLGLPLRDLPSIKAQNRKRKASSSIKANRMIGADTETVGGMVWLFSTEHGVWEIESWKDLIGVMFDRKHAVKWKKSKASKNGKKRGLATAQWFYWNLKFDAQACLKMCSDDVIDEILSGEKVKINCNTGSKNPIVNGEMIQLSYLEGKHLEIKPINWKIGQYHLGIINWWDISQFYYKIRLQTAAETILNDSKVETCFDGSILDASRFDDPEYRDFYREDIEKYAIHDAVLCGELARKCRDDYVSQGIRFIRPYSLANVAQRCLLDTSDIPTINSYLDDPWDTLRLQKALTAYHGGWFETSGCGYHADIAAVDLASAYPYVMYHLPDITKGTWVDGDIESEFWEWVDIRKPMSIGFAEASIVFEKGDWYPLVKKSTVGTLVSPRCIRGWFTADELAEARKWPHAQIIIGEWFYYHDPNPTYPFREFIDRFYKIKMEAASDPVAYKVAKVMLNSLYGKTIQAVEGKAGKLWNPLYASTITGSTRARLAEFNRLNGSAALSYATDGIMLPSEKFVSMPPRPAPACHNLGEWEHDGDGDALIIMSGVYSVRKGDKIKTTYRGSASYFVSSYRDGGLFRFCEENKSTDYVQKTVRRPYTAREARQRSDYTLINKFEPRSFSMTPMGDSTKRLWSGDVPKLFGDLLTTWFTSSTHEKVDILEAVGTIHDELVDGSAGVGQN